MKKEVLILLIFSFNCYSQSELKKLEKGVCKIDHKCYTKYEYDDFENVWTYSVGFYETMLAKDGLTYVITKYNEEKIDKKLITMTFFANATGCKSKNSYVHIQFKSGEKLKIGTYDSGTQCNVSYLTINITDFMDILEKEPIEKIRISIDGNDDFVVTEKGENKLFNNLKCIDAVNLKKT
ncbi:hypothetical protein SGQ83_07190 [Flavobacterium sp. Fl-318]|uniref:Lipocalin-like domain-containing protein n=1 Tax=Flavobacterium cupriresistens TaxID=2893885 RepID=A0ABU4R990_9FLAO|nr:MULTISPECIES: hypothetical protein [unclassified Flavobacterium]MDX6189124.1 hypothetical protein [Flavobacterium sp. Fl-318]UFH41221.1 hypothetical protein LNP23_15560 [Flavobacterium sp. F-323]